MSCSPFSSSPGPPPKKALGFNKMPPSSSSSSPSSSSSHTSSSSHNSSSEFPEEATPDIDSDSSIFEKCFEEVDLDTVKKTQTSTNSLDNATVLETYSANANDNGSQAPITPPPKRKTTPPTSSTQHSSSPFPSSHRRRTRSYSESEIFKTVINDENSEIELFKTVPNKKKKRGSGLFAEEEGADGEGGSPDWEGEHDVSHKRRHKGNSPLLIATLKKSTEASEISGYLSKLGRGNAWQRRWFETNGHHLTYYKSSKRQTCLALLDLTSTGKIFVDRRVDYNLRTFTIEVDSKPYRMVADTSAECKDWVICLNRIKSDALLLSNSTHTHRKRTKSYKEQSQSQSQSKSQKIKITNSCDDSVSSHDLSNVSALTDSLVSDSEESEELEAEAETSEEEHDKAPLAIWMKKRRKRFNVRVAVNACCARLKQEDAVIEPRMEEEVEVEDNGKMSWAGGRGRLGSDEIFTVERAGGGVEKLRFKGKIYSQKKSSRFWQQSEEKRLARVIEEARFEDESVRGDDSSSGEDSEFDEP